MPDTADALAEWVNSDYGRRVIAEISSVRSDFVDLFMERRLNHRRYDATPEQVADWEVKALKSWGQRHPLLAALVSANSLEKAS